MNLLAKCVLHAHGCVISLVHEIRMSLDRLQFPLLISISLFSCRCSNYAGNSFVASEWNWQQYIKYHLFKCDLPTKLIKFFESLQKIKNGIAVLFIFLLVPNRTDFPAIPTRGYFAKCAFYIWNSFCNFKQTE